MGRSGVLETMTGKTENVIILSGRLGSGKSLFAEYLSRISGYEVFEVGDAVREECAEKSPPSLPLEYAVEMFGRFGKDYFVKKILDKSAGKRCAIIVGIRSVEELECIRRIVPKVFVVVMQSDYDTRKERYGLRQKEKRKNSDFDVRDKTEEEWGIAEVFAYADAVVENGAEDINALKKKAHDVFDEYKEKFHE